MRYVAAYLLANLAGNENPDVKALEKILSSVGIECDKTKAEKVIKELKGKNVEDLIKQGSTKLATLPTASVAAAPAAGGAAAPAGGAKPAEKKEEPSKIILFYYLEFKRRLYAGSIDAYCSLSLHSNWYMCNTGARKLKKRVYSQLQCRILI